MLIAIVGLPLSGKQTIASHLVRTRNFTQLYLDPSSSAPSSSSLTDVPTTFESSSKLLSFVTKNWRSPFVTVNVDERLAEDELDAIWKRPFVLLVAVDAPLMTRFARAQAQAASTGLPSPSLESFATETDEALYGGDASSSDGNRRQPLRLLLKRGHLTVSNTYTSIPPLLAKLDELDFTDGERLRPCWDNYFMQLADLASMRSNCMKRRVGAVLTQNNRILATGYNGTPRGLTNCAEGGCARCNSGIASGLSMSNCLCLHAEENALLEAGRGRIVGDGVILYCNTCPCLSCAIKIIQTGVDEVVYNLDYSMDAESARIFREAGVKLRRYRPRASGMDA